MAVTPEPFVVDPGTGTRFPGTGTIKAKPKPKAVRRLEQSKLAPRSAQLEAMGKDLDIGQFRLYLASVLKLDIAKSIVKATINRTIEGASTVNVTVNDYSRGLLKSGILNSRLDVEVDGLWFRLVQVQKQDDGDDITLTFEDREICILRRYNKWKQARRTKATRAEFILNLIREPKEFKKIPVVIPELHTAQPVVKSEELSNDWEAMILKEAGLNPEADEGAIGIKGSDLVNRRVDSDLYTKYELRDIPSTALTVKGVAMRKDQMGNANAIISVGASMNAGRKVIVCAIMTAIQESTLTNIGYGDEAGPDSCGLFQQRDSWGTRAERLDPATAARLFYQRAIPVHKSDPARPYWDVCYAVQRCRADLKAKYEDHRAEAEKIVSAYGMYGGDNEESISTANLSQEPYTVGPEFMFYRGKLRSAGKTKEPESSWDCIQRLAEEVQWRAFFVSGTFYYIGDDDLYRQRPMMIINEFSPGVEGIGGDLDVGKRTATINIKARVGRWLVPPGAVVVLREMGPWNGRWLVTEFERDLLGDNLANITAKKPRPVLPEPEENQLDDGTFLVGSKKSEESQDKALFGGLENTDGSRQAIVDVALHALDEERSNHYTYLQKRPYPATLWSAEAHSPGIDCSSFATLVYKEAGAPDPNNLNYNGSGYTGTLADNPKGQWTLTPSPGDLALYGSSQSSTSHVAVYIGDGYVVGIGSNKGILKLRADYRSDLVGYKSYFTASDLP